MAAALLAPLVTTYEAEVDKANRDLAALAALSQRCPRDIEKRVRLSFRQYHRAVLTQEPAHFAAVEQSIAEMLRDFGPTEDICLLKANVDGHFHRLEQVKEALRLCPLLAARSAGRAIQSDIHQQEGRYEAARQILGALVAENDPAWDDLARLAHWTSKFADRREADQLYAQAEQELTAKELRSYSWLERARAELALSGGLLPQAHRHAERAWAAFPGHWKTLELKAKVFAAEGLLDQALAHLTAAPQSRSRPESQQAMGEILLALGHAEQARPWLERAEQIYLGSVNRGEVHYLHHLADFYAGTGGHPAEAVTWAREDLALRENFSTQSALAWALFRHGEISEGIHWAEQALGSGVKDESLFRTAAALYAASGNTNRASHFERAAVDLNPLDYKLHLHL
jgi:tetratricopeptide (TPR) repeat protein